VFWAIIITYLLHPHTRDLVECCEPNCEIYLFADYAKLFRHIVSPNDHCLLQTGIDALQH